MILVSTLFPGEVNINETAVASLVIENQDLFRRFLQSINNQINGVEGEIILSDNSEILKISKVVDLVLVPFGFSEKKLINKISNLLAKEAVSEAYYEKTMEMISNIERYVDSMIGFLPCTLTYTSINAESIIKMCGINIVDDSCNEVEKVFNYMVLMRDLLGIRLFVFVNIRSFFNDEDLQQFINDLVNHKFETLFVESTERPLLSHMSQLIVDSDLCII